MATRKTPIDVDEYLPDQATRDAVAAGNVKYNRNVDPKLLAELAELNRMESNPEILRVAPPSTAAYVPPTDLPSASEHDKTVPRAAPKVALALPPSPRELPTQPSLKRVRGEPEVPGVVKAPPVVRRISLRHAVLAAATVLLPVVVVIFVMARILRPAVPGAAGSAPASSTPAVKPTAQPSAMPSVTATAASAAPPAPSVIPTTTASAAVSAPTGAVVKRRSHAEPEDPYDAAAPAPSTTSAAAPSAVPSTTPTAAPSATPPPARSAEPRLPWFVK